MDFGILDNTVDRLDNVTSKFIIDENVKTLTLHNWQRKALKLFMKTNSILAECGTGTGKTFFGIECIKEVFKKDENVRVLIVSPKNVILEKVWYNELSTAGFNIRDIGVYYGAIKEPAKITLTNIQSVKDLDMKDFDFLILDEAHNTTSRLLNIFNSKEFKYKIGLSATLERLDKGHYDIMELFNYNIYRYNTEEALTDDVISFFEFYSIGIELDKETREEYEELTERINSIYAHHGSYTRVMCFADIAIKNQLLGLMNNRKMLVNNYKNKFIVLTEVIKKNMDSKILVFNQFNKQTNKSYWELLDIGISAEIIHSGIDKETRNTVLDNYRKDKFNVLLTSKVLDEGYNLPSIQVVILMSNDTGGRRQLIQRVGRSLRKKKDGSKAKIYYVFVKDTIEENDENIIFLKHLSSRYKEYYFEEKDAVKIDD